MTAPKTTRIALVGSGPETAALGAALGTFPEVSVERRDDSLTGLNGEAVRIAGGVDLILFRTDAGANLDIEAVRAMARAHHRTAALVALTPPELPLADARRLMQAGAADVVPWTVEAGELMESLGRWTRRNLPAVYEAPQRRGRITTVAQARGGIGASTLAVNLADRLQDRKGFRKRAQSRVVIVDLDIQFGSVASLLDAKESDALFQMADQGTLPDSTFVGQALSAAPNGVWVLPAPSKFAPLEALSAPQVGALLDALANDFDHVVVDLPRSLVQWVTAVLERTDRLLLLSDATVPSIRQARRLIDLYLETNPSLAIDVIMSQEHKPLIRSGQHAEAQRLLERPFKHWLPYDPRAARRAADRGAPLSVAAGSSPLSKAVAGLGRDLLQSLATPAAAKARP